MFSRWKRNDVIALISVVIAALALIWGIYWGIYTHIQDPNSTAEAKKSTTITNNSGVINQGTMKNSPVNIGITDEKLLERYDQALIENGRLQEIVKTAEQREALFKEIVTTLRAQNIAPERIPEKIADILSHVVDLEEQISALKLSLASVAGRELLDKAKIALDQGKLQEAERLLIQARNQQLIDVADTSVLLAKLALRQLRYDKAAKEFEKAANYLSDAAVDKHKQYIDDAASAWYTHGDEQGDNKALERSITLRKTQIDNLSRQEHPQQWARVQNNLGNALSELGERESGTARLEQAVAAYRKALEEWTQQRVPLDWATTQNNLGAALSILGARESGTARLEQAVTAYRKALEERTQQRVPLQWATTQNNLGAALRALGERESGTARLEQAVTAYRKALEERTQQRVPLQWATTQNNLGNALSSLGERESGTARLEQAVAAYRKALEEWTQQRVPLQWATTQNNLGNALSSLGARESGTARLEQAVAAYRKALEERTQQHVPLQWAMTQNNLGQALELLGVRNKDTALLHEALRVTKHAYFVDVKEAGQHHFESYYQKRLQTIQQHINGN
jgi:tetratricopeptide (TPR) repeat protein